MKIEKYLNEGTKSLPKEITTAISNFSNEVRDKWGEPLNKFEIKELKKALNKEVDRLATGYKGM